MQRNTTTPEAPEAKPEPQPAPAYSLSDKIRVLRQIRIRHHIIRAIYKDHGFDGR